jgi:hypothetical protein
VHVFDINTGAHLFKLRNPGLAREFHGDFGYALDVDQNLLLVGDSNAMDLCPSDAACTSGAAFVFDLTTGQQLIRLIPEVPEGGDYFGGSVAIEGQTAAIGRHTSSADVWLFDIPSGQELVRLSPADLNGAVAYGGIAISDGKALVGAPGENTVFVIDAARQPTTPIQAGDADQDLDFDQLDLVRVQQAAKYLTSNPATWGEGDWDRAPGGEVGRPPAGDGVFNQADIIAALRADAYLTGPYAAQKPVSHLSPHPGRLPVPEPKGSVLVGVGLACLAASAFGRSVRKSEVRATAAHDVRSVGCAPSGFNWRTGITY